MIKLMSCAHCVCSTEAQVEAIQLLEKCRPLDEEAEQLLAAVPHPQTTVRPTSSIGAPPSNHRKPSHPPARPPSLLASLG